MRRKLWALVLGATLALGALTGCGNTGTTTTDPAASPMEEMSPAASAAPSS